MSIRIDRVVTRGGDGGQTSLGDGSRVGKDSLRIDVLGALDELNAVLGLVRAHAAHSSKPATAQPETQSERELAALQNLLFDMGAELCMPEGPKAQRVKSVEDTVVLELESWIERMRADQQPLSGFVLPGGSLAACWAHMARTQTRRAERQLVALAQLETINPVLLKILNRLSDYFFVLARYFNQNGQSDLLWQPRVSAKAE
ncbi:cob(I)yrinic acid a,c-diamide adenosyltransferase [Acetobacter suratthaniensis]|uniref:Corrinoid adenosyltransferase n=1 Tax=Acetobacter suratthaniensis TaxID=1502841 RepID=A0ABS3LHH9_9PROT|nr:cob(I)yrinic acid a,c-diamide adenosyltransferase [Acetobacter suratthaniensis]MBO1327029.1 cob(I)yrinic acid a,c-diamide adenosyltransferase [Acetobacter suratthaniensis]MCX2565361.1 cob(I)yrinic acid a,c-diamide adenosyltransferase [Acetobacter suratthaniensis]